MFSSVEDDMLIRFIADQKQVMLFCERGHRFERGFAHDRAGGIVRRVDEDGFGFLCDRGFDILGAIKIFLILAQTNRHGNASTQPNVLGDFRPHRVGQNHFIARIENGAKDDV